MKFAELTPTQISQTKIQLLFELESCRENMDINYMLEENFPLHRFTIENALLFIRDLLRKDN